MELKFREVVPSPDLLMGAKAVWGRSEEPIMCFGTKGASKSDSKQYYSQARRTAEKSLNQPYFLTIGGGAHVPAQLNGRVIELVRATPAFGDTSAMVQSENLRSRLEQWPVAVMLSEVYAITGEPHLIDELGMPDRNILANAYDSVRRDDSRIAEIWEILSDWPVKRRVDVVAPPGFREPKTVRLIGTLYPTVSPTSTEGREVWRLSREIERDPAITREVKSRNRLLNGGTHVCESCGFADERAAMFDAHHLTPLAAGVRESRVDDLAVLCPTCHRWAHVKGANRLSPLSIAELRECFLKPKTISW